MRPLLTTLLTLAAFILLATPAAALEVTATKSEVTFHISHPAKEYDANLLPGGAKMVATVNPTDLSQMGFDVSIQVDKFNSDNTRRDSHMIETMEALIFPTITWKVTKLDGPTGPVAAGSYKGFASGPLTVHGVTETLEAPITMTISESGDIAVKSDFSVSLERFGIDRPTLVFVPIKDDVPIKVSVVFPGGTAIFPPAAAPEPSTEEPVPADPNSESPTNPKEE